MSYDVISNLLGRKKADEEKSSSEDPEKVRNLVAEISRGMSSKPDTVSDARSESSQFKRTAAGKTTVSESLAQHKPVKKAVLKHTTGMSSSALHRRQSRKPTQAGITRPAIIRLARRAGIKRLGGQVRGGLINVTEEFLAELLSYAIITMQHAHRKTVSSADINIALDRRFGRKIYGLEFNRRRTMVPRIRPLRRLRG